MASLKQFQQLERLKGWRQQVFVAALAQRALPNLQFFTQLLALELPLAPERLMDAVWYAIEQHEKLHADSWITALEDLAGELSEREEYGARPAGDAAVLLLNATDLLLHPEQKLARQSAELSLQTVTGFVEFSEGDELSEHDLVTLLDRHPLVRNELALQRHVADEVRRATAPTATLLTALRELSDQGGVSNIGISLAEEDAD